MVINLNTKWERPKTTDTFWKLKFENTQKKTSGGQFWPIWRKGGAAKIEKIEDRAPKLGFAQAHMSKGYLFLYRVRHCVCRYIYIYPDGMIRGPVLCTPVGW